MITSQQIQVGSKYIYRGKKEKLKGQLFFITRIDHKKNKFGYKGVVYGYFINTEFDGDYSIEWFSKNMVIPANKDRFILWNPDSTTPPSKVFPSYIAARHVQKTWKMGKYCDILKLDGTIEDTIRNATSNHMEDSMSYAMAMLKTKEMNETNIEESEMKSVNVLKIEGKTLLITDEQAEILGGVGNHESYSVKSALMNRDGKVYKANQIELTEVEAEIEGD